MTPEEVPDGLLGMAHMAMRFSDEQDTESALAEALAVVLPEYEKRVREQVAKAIEETVCAPPEGHTKPCPDCYRHKQMQKDARIARGQA
jgi:hypothetical protein